MLQFIIITISVMEKQLIIKKKNKTKQNKTATQRVAIKI